MKTFTFLIAMLLTFISKGQGVIADPAISQVGVENLNSTVLNPASIAIDNSFEIKIPYYNYNILNSLPQGSCKIKIGLGSKIKLAPQFDFSTLPSSVYFNWTSDSTSGQVQVTGELKTDLPPNFSDSVILKVIGDLQGNSTITINFLVTNHNTQVILSDQNPTNNNSFLAYTIVAAGPLPVTFTGLTAVNKGCIINVDFSTEREINVNKYDIEVSKDGTYFVKEGEVNADNAVKYHYDVPITASIKAPVVFIRIKSVDKDGSFKYSPVKSVKGSCDDALAVSVYPNPARNIASIVVTAKQGYFNGKYIVRLSDMTGKLVILKDLTLANTDKFTLNTGTISSGQYIINISNQDNGESSMIQWQKY